MTGMMKRFAYFIGSLSNDRRTREWALRQRDIQANGPRCHYEDGTGMIADTARGALVCRACGTEWGAAVREAAA